MSVLAGRRVLIVEDEAIIAMTIEDMLIELGCEPVGPAASLAEGLRLAADATIDAAVLDINLNGVRSDDIARLLRARGVPYIFATGYGREGVGEGLDAPVLAKPYRIDQVEAALGGLIGG